MLIIIDRNTKQVINNHGTNSLFPDGNIPGVILKENEEAIKIHDSSEDAAKIMNATQYSFNFDDNGNYAGVEILETMEQYRQNNPLTQEELLEPIRAERNRLLAECDWTQLPDAPLTEEQALTWREYRQSLRDLPQTIEDLNNFEWPTKP